MRLHTDILTSDHFNAAACVNGLAVGVPIFREHGSRIRARAFEIQLSGSGRDGGAFGHTRFRTALWDEWGIFLAHLYRFDPAMVSGRAYLGAEDFHACTDHRFVSLHAGGMCARHRWDYGGTHFTCAKCGAEREAPYTTTYRREREGIAFPGGRTVAPARPAQPTYAPALEPRPGSARMDGRKEYPFGPTVKPGSLDVLRRIDTTLAEVG